MKCAAAPAATNAMAPTARSAPLEIFEPFARRKNIHLLAHFWCVGLSTKNQKDARSRFSFCYLYSDTLWRRLCRDYCAARDVFALCFYFIHIVFNGTTTVQLAEQSIMSPADWSFCSTFREAVSGLRNSRGAHRAAPTQWCLDSGAPARTYLSRHDNPTSFTSNCRDAFGGILHAASPSLP